MRNKKSFLLNSLIAAGLLLNLNACSSPIESNLLVPPGAIETCTPPPDSNIPYFKSGGDMIPISSYPDVFPADLNYSYFTRFENGETFDPTKLNVVFYIIGSAYYDEHPEIRELLPDLISAVSNAYSKVPLHIITSIENIPLNTYRKDGSSAIYFEDDSFEIVTDFLSRTPVQIYPVFIVSANTWEVAGTSYSFNGLPLSILNSDSGMLYAAVIHELGHQIAGLPDEYTHYVVDAYANHTTYFTELHAANGFLPSTISDLYTAGVACNGKPVFSVSPRANVMSDGLPKGDSKFKAYVADGGDIFTSAQKELIAQETAIRLANQASAGK